MGTRSARIAVRLSPDLRDRLDAEALAAGVPYSELVKMAIVRLLTDLEQLRGLLPQQQGEGT